MFTRKLTNDLTGKTFGRLSVVRRAAPQQGKKQQKTRYVCACSCGAEKVIRGDALTSGATTSCGCLSRERSTTHGMRHTVVYRKWIGMRQRCNDPNCPQYPRYGGRGIKVSERWNSFESFLEDMGLPPTGKHQPDRIDNDGDYELGNVRWATPQQNANNRSNNRFYEYCGERKTLREWANRTGIKYSTLQYRIDHGWTMERALNESVDQKKAVGGRYARK